MIDITIPLVKLNEIGKNTLIERIGIEFIELGEDFIVGTMPVDKRTHQPAGLLHGGATASLIETLGSMGSLLLVDSEKYNIVGIEINVNHMRGVKNGNVTCHAKAVHVGRSTHVWQMNVTDENQKLVATGRLTIMVIAK